jgi:hypothetical protein
MSPSRPRLTPQGLLSESFGRRPNTVALREEKEPGSNVLLDYSRAGDRRKESLGYPVRTGKRGWDWDALQRARDTAEDRAAELRLGQLRAETKEDLVTVGTAFALYHEPERGGVRGAATTIHRHKFTRREWERWLGVDTPWNAITPADVEGLIRKYKDRDMAPTARELLKNLRACYNWLRKKRGLRHLNDPTESLSIAEVMEGHTPNRPRYTPEEARKIVAVRDAVDPRFALLVALMDDSGARREALRRMMRSNVDTPLTFDPGDRAPHGWIVLPALKGQVPGPTFLTAFQRREIDRALTGYLSELERIYQETKLDYPLFPAAKVRSTANEVVHPHAWKDDGGTWRPGQTKAYEPISRGSTRDWLIEAEQKAGVQHVEGRGWHGIRRAVSDYLEEATDLATLTTAMGWSSQSVPESIYLEKGKLEKRGRAREAMEKKRHEP